MCNEVFTDRDQLTKHLEIDHTKTDQQLHQQLPLKRLLIAAGKYNCYFEGCNDYFESTDKLNEHLMSHHNMLYKDVEARSKMNLMFLEQIKHQMTEQYVHTLGAINGSHHLQSINKKINETGLLDHSSSMAAAAAAQSSILDATVKFSEHKLNENDLRTNIYYNKPDKKQKLDSQVRLC